MLTYLIFVVPPALLAMYAQAILKSRYAKAQKAPCQYTGYQAARAILDSAGLQSVQIERIAGSLTDHYDPRAKVLRLSENSYSGHNLASVGVAAHEAGHAIQDASHYKLMVLRQMAVPLASLGSNSAMALIVAGAALQITGLLLAGVAAFGMVALFQIINLPVEYDASSRAKKLLGSLGFVPAKDAPIVKGVLSAAALTYVAAMLSSVAVFLYYLLSATRSRD
ncbi:MAG: zinc metallopeptidase [Planctomycetia bacterium]|nr:zinc metallopeptidase [Planctomycetia bacterium]